MVQTPVSGKNGPVSIQPGDWNNWFATRPADYRDFVSFVLLTLPGLLNRPTRSEGPVWESVRGSLVSVNGGSRREVPLCETHLVNFLSLQLSLWRLTVHTSASTEDRLNSLKQVSGRAHPVPQISVACATNLRYLVHSQEDFSTNMAF